VQPTLPAFPAAQSASLSRTSRRAVRRFVAALAVIVLVFVGYPLLAVFKVFDGAEIARALIQADPLINSLLVAGLTVIPATLIGVPLAWLCARTDLPGRGLIGFLVSISFVVPVLLLSIAYIFLFGRNAGLVNGWFKGIFSGPVWNSYSFSGVVLVSVLHSYPLVFFTTLSGLSKINPELEEAGRICGLSPAGVFFRITLGAILPSILVGVAFVIAESLTMLAAPLLLGLPVGIRFVTTELYATIVMNPDLGAAVAMSLPLVTVTLIVLWAQNWFTGGAGSSRFAVLTGKGARSEIVELGRWRTAFLVLAWLPVAGSLIIPVATLLAAALMDRWWRGLEWANLTIKNFAFILEDDTTRRAIWNSVLLSGTVGFAMALLGGLLAIVLAGEQTPLKRAIRQLAVVPLGLPHVVAGVLVILAWYGAPFNLGGTVWILVFGYVLVMLPYAVRTCEAARGQIDASLGEAAQIAGCSPVQTWRHVMLPLMKNGLVTTFVLVFLFVIKEFSLTAMVYSAGTQTLAVRVYTYLEGGSYEKTAAAAMLLLLITFASLAIAGKVLRISVTSLKV
jgi:iron(III) transport system permease protein